MILEYKKFIKSNVIIEVLEGPYWDFILNEHCNFLNEGYNFEYYDDKKRIPIIEEYQKKLRDMEEILENHLNKINPFEGKHYNERRKNIRKIKFDLETTGHWYKKFFRKKYENDKYIIPGLYEGIDIIYNNIDDITTLIDTDRILNNYRVMIKSKEIGKYSEIIIFKKIDPNTYNMTLQTQMKGKDYIDDTVDRIVKLHPKGKKNPPPQVVKPLSGVHS